MYTAFCWFIRPLLRKQGVKEKGRIIWSKHYILKVRIKRYFQLIWKNLRRVNLVRDLLSFKPNISNIIFKTMSVKKNTHNNTFSQ